MHVCRWNWRTIHQNTVRHLEYINIHNGRKSGKMACSKHSCHPVRAVPTSRSFVFHLTTWVTWPTLSVWFWTWPWDPLLSKNRKLAKLNITSKNKQRFSVLIIFIATLIGSHPTHCSYLHQYIYTLQAAVPDKELTATRHVSGLKRRNVLRSPLTLCCHMQFPVQIMNSLYI